MALERSVVRNALRWVSNGSVVSLFRSLLRPADIVNLVLGWRDANWMCARRADYYAYLSALLAAQNGKRSLRDFFDDDAVRYGLASARGRLSATWRRTFEQGGGCVAHTWAGVFPRGDLAILDAAQREGVGALCIALSDLARVTSLLARLRRHALATCMASIVATTVVLAMAWGISAFTVPRLKHVFETVPASLAGPATQSLYTAAALFQYLAPLGVVLFCTALGALAWAVPRWTGSWRRRLDSAPFFRIYRDIQAIRFLCALSLVMGRLPMTDMRLRDGLNALAPMSTPWMAAHLNAMTQRIVLGERGIALFDTGLFERELYWFMVDVVAARGLSEGLIHVRSRAEDSFADRIIGHVQFLRWAVLLTAVGCALGMALWHVIALDELRRGLVFSMSSQ